MAQSGSNGRSKPANESMSAWQLCEFDDYATMIVIDSYLGFQTHKMNTRFRPVRKYMDRWREAVQKFAKTQNYDQCFSEMTENNPWFEQHFGNQPTSYIESFRSHLYKFLHFFDPDSGITIKECCRYSSEKKGGKIVGENQFVYFSYLV